MEITAKQIAALVDGRIEGDESAQIGTFCRIEEGAKGAITFLSSPKYTHYLYTTSASVVLVDESITIDKPTEATLIYVKNVRDCVAKLLQMYESMKAKPTGVSEHAYVSSKATLGENVYVGPFAYIGDGVTIGDNTQVFPNTTILDGVTIGSNCILYPNVTVYHGCKIGNGVILHAGSVIGADGFGFAPNPATNQYDKIPQIGIVTLEDNVEIGANTCVDRSTMGATIVRKGVKLDNLVQIAHNTDIGENTVMSAQVGIAGSTKVGQWCMFGGQVGIAGHITIGDKVFLGAQSGVPGSLKSNQQLIGTPPMEQRPFFKSQALFRRLPEMRKEIDELRKEIEQLKQNK